jgi:hypothetical protein
MTKELTQEELDLLCDQELAYVRTAHRTMAENAIRNESIGIIPDDVNNLQEPHLIKQFREKGAKI